MEKEIDELIAPIFCEYYDGKSKRNLIIEEENNTVWAYLTHEGTVVLAKDCFFFSRKEVESKIADWEYYSRNKIAPPITKEFASSEAHLPHVICEMITVNWNDEAVLVKINELPFLIFQFNEGLGYSKSIKKSGVYGNAWNEELSEKIFNQKSN